MGRALIFTLIVHLGVFGVKGFAIKKCRDLVVNILDDALEFFLLHSCKAVHPLTGKTDLPFELTDDRYWVQLESIGKEAEALVETELLVVVFELLKLTVHRSQLLAYFLKACLD